MPFECQHFILHVNIYKFFLGNLSKCHNLKKVKNSLIYRIYGCLTLKWPSEKISLPTRIVYSCSAHIHCRNILNFQSSYRKCQIIRFSLQHAIEIVKNNDLICCHMTFLKQLQVTILFQLLFKGCFQFIVTKNTEKWNRKKYICSYYLNSSSNSSAKKETTRFHGEAMVHFKTEDILNWMES